MYNSKGALWPAAAELALALVGLIVGYVVIGALAMAVRPVLGAVVDDAAPIVGLVGGPLITVVAAVFYAAVAPRWMPVRDVAVEPKAGLGSTAAIVTLAVIAAIVGSVVIGLLLDLLGVPIEEQQSVLEIVRRARAGEGWRDAILLSISALCIAPAAEEFLFRGLLFRRIRAASGRPLAYVLSMLAFAAIHGNVKGLAVYAWLGLCFAIALERTHRLSAAIAVHVANNAFVLANLLLL